MQVRKIDRKFWHGTAVLAVTVGLGINDLATSFAAESSGKPLPWQVASASKSDKLKPKDYMAGPAPKKQMAAPRIELRRRSLRRACGRNLPTSRSIVTCSSRRSTQAAPKKVM